MLGTVSGGRRPAAPAPNGSTQRTSCDRRHTRDTHVEVPVNVEDTPHRLVESAGCQLALLTVGLLADETDLPLPVRHPEEEGMMEEGIRGGWRYRLYRRAGCGGYHQS